MKKGHLKNPQLTSASLQTSSTIPTSTLGQTSSKDTAKQPVNHSTGSVAVISLDRGNCKERCSSSRTQRYNCTSKGKLCSVKTHMVLENNAKMRTARKEKLKVSEKDTCVHRRGEPSAGNSNPRLLVSEKDTNGHKKGKSLNGNSKPGMINDPTVIGRGIKNKISINLKKGKASFSGTRNIAMKKSQGAAGPSAQTAEHISENQSDEVVNLENQLGSVGGKDKICLANPSVTKFVSFKNIENEIKASGMDYKQSSATSSLPSVGFSVKKGTANYKSSSAQFATDGRVRDLIKHEAGTSSLSKCEYYLGDLIL